MAGREPLSRGLVLGRGHAGATGPTERASLAIHRAKAPSGGGEGRPGTRPGFTPGGPRSKLERFAGEDQFLIILDIDRVLSEEDLRAVAAA
jgi:hypothetical protein